MSVTDITSLANPKVKHCVKLRQRSHRDEFGQMLIEGYRECRRALDHRYRPQMLFFCEELYLKHENEPVLVAECEKLGAECFACSTKVFEKLA